MRNGRNGFSGGSGGGRQRIDLRDEDIVGNRHHCPPRLNGWSVVMGSMAMVLLVVVTVASGSPTVGVVACGGLGISICALVAAEIVNHYDTEQFGGRDDTDQLGGRYDTERPRGRYDTERPRGRYDSRRSGAFGAFQRTRSDRNRFT